MIEVRNPADAAAYAWLAGHTLLEKRRPRPGVEVWACAWRDQLRELVFVENPAAAPPLTPQQFEQVGREVLATLPDGPQLFVRGEGKRVFEDALLAGSCLIAAGAETPGSPLAPLLATCNTRRAAMAKALPALPESLPIEAIPVPPHGFQPESAEQRWLATAAPLAVSALPEPWQVVGRGTDGRFLLRHPDHALAWATVLTTGADRSITRLEGITGREALTALLTYGFRLEEVQRARLRAVARPSRTNPDDPASPAVSPSIESVLAMGLGEGRFRAILELRPTPARKMRLVEVETRDPRYKAALIAFFLEPGADGIDRVVGLRAIEGVDGYEMLRLADAFAPTLVGRDGSRPEAEQIVDTNTEIVRIAANVEPVIAAMLAGPGVAVVRPRPGDAARVFTPAIAAKAEAAYAVLWTKDPPRIPGPAGDVRLTIRVCPAGLFGSTNPLATVFPTGYAAIASSLLPHCTWVAFGVVRPGSTRDFDGLVWVADPQGGETNDLNGDEQGGRWVWFPAPWRVLPGLETEN